MGRLLLAARMWLRVSIGQSCCPRLPLVDCHLLEISMPQSIGMHAQCRVHGSSTIFSSFIKGHTWTTATVYVRKTYMRDTDHALTWMEQITAYILGSNHQLPL